MSNYSGLNKGNNISQDTAAPQLFLFKKLLLKLVFITEQGYFY